MKKLLLINAILLIVYLFFSINKNEEKENKIYDVKLNLNDEIIELDLNSYIKGVLSCEMPALFEDEALKAGAIAIRSFYLYNLEKDNYYITNTNEQCYKTDDELKQIWKENYDTYNTKLENIVELTSDEVVKYDGEVAKTFYFSMTNGYTENSKNVFNLDLPYLVSKDSTWDKAIKTYEKEITLSIDNFKELLGISNPDIYKIEIVSRNESNRVNKIIVNDTTYTGVQFRKLLNLRSTDFEIQKKEDEILIKTYGYGHGVGMSQYGANMMAKNGSNYKEILEYYYDNTIIEKYDV